MHNRKWYEWLLTITFFAMIALCVGLNLTTGQKEGTANIIVNGVMFLIVGLIFVKCEIGSFFPMNRIIADLHKATEKIRSDALNSHQFLWEPYKTSGVELFEEKHLLEAFQDYRFELNRITNNEKAYYKCDIEDYINTGIVDAVMHRNVLNQVPGVMTGLGILGTFIGLSLGLQHFSTGTTAEVTGSIAPLMDGIKVAFHTSIYGMVFSLVFNYAYKCKLDEAENAIGDFIGAYKKYVLPDTTTDGINKLMELQQQQVTAVRRMTDRVSEDLGRLMEPQFDRLNQTITDFSTLATQSQKEALSQVVNAFIREMNQSLGGTFLQLNESFNKAYSAQQKNEQLLGGIQQRAEMNQQVLYQEQEYLTDLAQYRQSLAEASAALNAQLQQQEALMNDLRRVLSQMNKTLTTSYENAENAWARTADAVDDLRESLELSQKSRARR